MKRFSALFLLLLLLPATTYAWLSQAWEYREAATAITFGWDDCQGATHYEYRLILELEPETAFAEGSTTETQVTITRPRSGHFRLEVRACDPNAQPTCTPWATSRDSGYIEGIGQKSWVIYWMPPTPGTPPTPRPTGTPEIRPNWPTSAPVTPELSTGGS